MALMRKLKKILVEAFPPPDTIKLRNHDGIVGIVTSARFQNMDSMERQDLIHDILQKRALSREDMRQILVIVAVTPDEETALSATD
jgi:hypothetical protein